MRFDCTVFSFDPLVTLWNIFGNIYALYYKIPQWNGLICDWISEIFREYWQIFMINIVNRNEMVWKSDFVGTALKKWTVITIQKKKNTALKKTPQTMSTKQIQRDQDVDTLRAILRKMERRGEHIPSLLLTLSLFLCQTQK